MISVTDKNYQEINLNIKTNNREKKQRIILLNNQLRWLNDHKSIIYTKAKLLYNLYKNDKLPKNVKDRCCNFLILEEKNREYNHIGGKKC